MQNYLSWFIIINFFNQIKLNFFNKINSINFISSINIQIKFKELTFIEYLLIFVNLLEFTHLNKIFKFQREFNNISLTQVEWIQL